MSLSKEMQVQYGLFLWEYGIADVVPVHLGPTKDINGDTGDGWRWDFTGKIDGDVLGTIEFVFHPGTQNRDPAGDDVVDYIAWRDLDGKLMRTMSNVAIAYSDLRSGLADDDPQARYAFIVSLHDGKLSLAGSNGGDTLEIGTGGKATVSGRGGADKLFVWQDKTVVFDGGDGADTVYFNSQFGFVPTPGEGAVVDLGKGTGINPYGGTLTLSDVENVVGTGAGDKLSGNAKDNLLASEGGEDRLLGRGGDDRITVRSNFDGSLSAFVADGGTGTDTLAASDFRFAGENTLHLDKPAQNSGIFADAAVRGFEVFQFFGFDANTVFNFHGGDGGEAVFSYIGDDTLAGGGGDDRLSGGLGLDHLRGDGGGDRFVFSRTIDSASDRNSADVIEDFSGKDRIDVRDIDAKFAASGNQAFKFIGSDSFSGEGQVRFVKAGGTTYVEFNTTGAAGADMVIALAGNIDLKAGDFLL